MSKNQIGIVNSSIKTEGYYYRERIYTSFSHKRINNSGSFEIDSSQYKIVGAIDYFVFNKDGYMLFRTSSAYFDESDSFLKVHLEIQKELLYQGAEGLLNKNDIWFFTKNALVWDNGVFKAEDDKILIQLFYNGLGDYYLKNLEGAVKDSVIIIHDWENEIYKYNPCQISSFFNYIQQHPQKFWR